MVKAKMTTQVIAHLADEPFPVDVAPDGSVHVPVVTHRESLSARLDRVARWAVVAQNMADGMPGLADQIDALEAEITEKDAQITAFREAEKRAVADRGRDRVAFDKVNQERGGLNVELREAEGSYEWLKDQKRQSDEALLDLRIQLRGLLNLIGKAGTAETRLADPQ